MFKLIKDVLSALNTVVRFILDGSGRKKKRSQLKFLFSFNTVKRFILTIGLPFTTLNTVDFSGDRNRRVSSFLTVFKWFI